MKRKIPKTKPSITVEHYQVREGPGKCHTPFHFKRLWCVTQPSLEIASKLHGDLSLAFNADGSISLTHWSSRIPIGAEDVRPTNLTIHQ